MNNPSLKHRIEFDWLDEISTRADTSDVDSLPISVMDREWWLPSCHLETAGHIATFFFFLQRELHLGGPNLGAMTGFI